MQHHADVVFGNPHDRRDLFVAQIFEKQRDERFLQTVELRNRLEHLSKLFIFMRIVGGKIFGNFVQLIGITAGDLSAAGFVFANKADSRIEGDPIKPGICKMPVFQIGQCPPDLEQNFLIEIVLIGCVPRIDAANLQDLRPVFVKQLQKLPVIYRIRIHIVFI